MIDKFILVAVDITTSLGSSWCVNSRTTGNWEDFVIGELKPYIDANFRTLPKPESQGVAGEFIGGYCAIRFGMRHPDVFGSVYALHPVGTGSGDQLITDTRLTQRLRDNFFLESMIPQYAGNLKSLRGLKFDWGRSDLNQDHVYSNQAFTHKLNEFGIPHEAEEYNGVWGDKTWGDDGRI